MIYRTRVTLLKVRKNQKADWWAVDSPKKRTEEFDLFAVKNKKANESRKKIMEALYQLSSTANRAIIERTHSEVSWVQGFCDNSEEIFWIRVNSRQTFILFDLTLFNIIDKPSLILIFLEVFAD